jgi:hypothetical protein
MKPHFAMAVSMLAGATLGAAAVRGPARPGETANTSHSRRQRPYRSMENRPNRASLDCLREHRRSENSVYFAGLQASEG